MNETMKKKERQVNIIMAIIMSAVMGLLFAGITRMAASPEELSSMPPAPIMYISSTIESIIVGVIITFIIPMGKMGRGLAAKFGANPGSMKFNLINSIPFAVINAVVVSIACSMIGVGQSYSHIPADVRPPFLILWFSKWIKTLPLSIVVGYVIAIIIAPFVIKAVGLGGPPEGVGRPGKPAEAEESVEK